MTPIQQLQSFIDERWAACRSAFYPNVLVAPRVHPETTPWEAEYFLDSVRRN